MISACTSSPTPSTKPVVVLLLQLGRSAGGDARIGEASAHVLLQSLEGVPGDAAVDIRAAQSAPGNRYFASSGNSQALPLVVEVLTAVDSGEDAVVVESPVQRVHLDAQARTARRSSTVGPTM